MADKFNLAFKGLILVLMRKILHMQRNEGNNAF